ncbi:MAG: TetR/AcrR family transcriptional regulator [Solirubrobacterales bacterium]
MTLGAGSQRDRIVEAMLACCAEKTYAATTIGDLVARAGVSRTTFYKHFDDKRACFDATLDLCLERLREVAAGSVSGADSPVEAVRRASAALLEELAARPELARLLSAEAIAVEPLAPLRYRDILVGALERLWRGRVPSGAETDPGLASGRAQLLVFAVVAAGRPEQLPQLHPDVVYLALAPFTGHEEARRQSRLAAEDVHPGPLLRA